MISVAYILHNFIRFVNQSAVVVNSARLAGDLPQSVDLHSAPASHSDHDQFRLRRLEGVYGGDQLWTGRQMLGDYDDHPPSADSHAVECPRQRHAQRLRQVRLSGPGVLVVLKAGDLRPDALCRKQRRGQPGGVGVGDNGDANKSANSAEFVDDGLNEGQYVRPRLVFTGLPRRVDDEYHILLCGGTVCEPQQHKTVCCMKKMPLHELQNLNLKMAVRKTFAVSLDSVSMRYFHVSAL